LTTRQLFGFSFFWFVFLLCTNAKKKNEQKIKQSKQIYQDELYQALKQTHFAIILST